MAARRILHVIHELTIDQGVMAFIMNMYRNIDREKVQFDFAYYVEKPGTYRDEILRLGGRVDFIPMPALLHPFRFTAGLDQLLAGRPGEYSAVHLHVAFLASAVFPTARKHGIRHLITHSHNTKYSEYRLNSLRNRLLCLGLKRQANIYFACSNKAGAFLYGRRAMSSGAVKIIRYAIDCGSYRFDGSVRDEVRKELGLGGRLVIGHVGRFAEQKNHRFLVEIFRALHAKNGSSMLLLVGDGRLMPEIKDRIERWKLSKDVLFLGRRTDIPRLMQAMDLFLLPSLFEGLPVVGVEAQAAGLPCVMADTITQETDITRAMTFLSLAEPPEAWADEILKVSGGFRRQDSSGAVAAAGFDIVTEARRLQEFYLNLE
jgi:glycosyltransferase involved in cell wall biosynthesis